MKCDHPATQVVTQSSTRGQVTAKVECSRCYCEIAKCTGRKEQVAIREAKKRASRKFTGGAGWHDVPPEPGRYIVRKPGEVDMIVGVTDPDIEPEARYYGPIPPDEKSRSA